MEEMPIVTSLTFFGDGCTAVKKKQMRQGVFG